MLIKRLICVSLCLMTTLLAQSEQQVIRLLDMETALPIVNATYQYGGQQGISDQNGDILFFFKEKTELKLSHVSYGDWTLNEQEVHEAIQRKVYYRQTISIDLPRITVIGLRYHDLQPQAELPIAYQERLEHDAADILNQVAAFNSIRKGGRYGFDPVFRGFNSDQLNVVLHGAQSATAACPNRMDPPTSQMAPNMLDRIEILKGPHTLRYGVGLGATINFIPTKMRFVNQPKFFGRFSAGAESNGNLKRSEAHLGLSSNKYEIAVFTAWSQGADYKAGNGETIQSDFSRGNFGTHLGFKLSSSQLLRVSAFYNRARNADFPALPMDLRKDDTWMFSIRHDIQMGGDKLQSWSTTVFGSFVDHLMNNYLKPLNPRMVNAETPAQTYNYGGRTEGTWQFTNKKLYAGADLRMEGATGTRVREFLMGPNAGKIFEDNVWQDGQIGKVGLFAEYQINGNLMDYVLSGRVDVNQADINDPANEFVLVNTDPKITQMNPSFSVGVVKSLGDKTKAGLWLARAQRSGNLSERFINYLPVGQDPYEMLGNPQLSPEVNNQIDLTFNWTIDHLSSLNVDVYAAYLQDYISSQIDPSLTPRLPMSPGVRQYVNIDEAFKTGFEIQWRQKLVAGLNHHLGIAYTYAQDLQRDEPLPQIAPLDLRYELFGGYFNNNLRPKVLFHYVAKQSRISKEFGETATPSFTRLDINIGYQIYRQVSIDIGINNVFDENYYEHLNRLVQGMSYPIYAPGRNIFANLNFSF